MIDWASGWFPCSYDSEKLNSGLIASLLPTGEIEWITHKKTIVEGSYSAKFTLKAHTQNLIYFSGNPSKFLQGHNLFGSNDLRSLLTKTFNELLKKEDLGLRPDPFQLENIYDGNYLLTRVDINETWHLDSEKDVLAWIRAVGEKAFLKHRGTGQFKGDTSYFGKDSERWGLKCYSKGQEIKVKGRQLPIELQIPEMLEYASKALRIEAFIRQKELNKKRLNQVSDWDIDTAEVLLLEYLSKLELGDIYMLKDDVLNSLPPKLRMVYQSWLNGDDLKVILPRPTFYRYRKQMLAYGLDISTKSPKEKSNVIPLVRVLEAKPVGIPHWAYEKGLVA